MAGVILIGSLFVFVFLGVPIALSLALSCVLYILMYGTVDFAFVVQNFLNGTNSFTLLAIPFFILAGELMVGGGISQRLINFCMSLVKKRKGGLGIVTVIACMIFAAISGSGPATVACIGSIMIPQMVRHGYNKPFATAIASAAGALGPIIPPSIMFLLYGVANSVSVSKLFMAGFVPGILMTVVLCVMTRMIVIKENFVAPPEVEAEDEKIYAVSIWTTLKDSIWALMVPIIILGGIYGGIFSPTEAAVVACVYALFIGFFIYKELTLKSLPGIFIRATRSCSFLVVIAFSTAFGKLLSLEGVTTAIADGVLGLTNNKIIILILINVVLLIVGMIMDAGPAIIILSPILLGIVKPLGVDPIHFGVIMIMNLSIGLITPPVGVNLFVGTKITNISMESTFKYVFTLLAGMLAVLLVITYIPGISLLLPGLMG
jgi:C4-dicarboxylate transporter DctM subunit